MFSLSVQKIKEGMLIAFAKITAVSGLLESRGLMSGVNVRSDPDGSGGFLMYFTDVDWPTQEDHHVR
jgi:hypothetical protein